MTEKYCLLPIPTCEFGTDRKADCENCELNKRFRKRTIDNWESYIEDRKTGKEYGADINPLINLLNEQEERIQELKKENEKYRQILLDFGVRTIFKENTVLRDGDCDD